MDKSKLISMFKRCLDILRDKNGITGEKALRNMTYLLILKLIEPQINKTIEINEDDFELENDEGEYIYKVFNFNDLLTNIKEDDLPSVFTLFWKRILQNHTILKHIFIKNKTFDITKSDCYKCLIKEINSIDFGNTRHDILGSAYEEVIQDIMTGKVFGQFFTPPEVKNIMIELVNPTLNDDGTIQSIGDPAMGTGGFLINYLHNIQQQAVKRNIQLNYDNIINNMYGRELEVDTYQLAISNLLITTGKIFSKLENGDSIRKETNGKFDIILANPPFGIKGLTYKDIHNNTRNEYIPIETSNAVSLFLQLVIHILKINGKCAIVIPDGKDLFSTSKVFVNVREYLMKTCELKEIIYLPSGIFTNTTIKTTIFFFIKKVEGKNILTINDKTKTRTYKFSKELQTKEVEFYEYTNKKTLLVKASIDDIVKNKYILKYDDYLPKPDIKKVFKEDIEIKTLGEICKISSGNHSMKKTDFIIGDYPIIGGGKTPSGYHNSFNCDENIILCASTGSAGYISMYPVKTFMTVSFSIIINVDYVLNMYLYYYLKSIETNISLLARGVAQQCIKICQLKEIQIPIPSIEQQEEIIKYLNFIYEKTNKTSNNKITELKQLNEFCLNNQKIYGDNVVKELDEISIINYDNMKSKQYTEINYIDITSVKEGYILKLQKLTNDFPSRAKRIVKKGDILYSSVRPNLKGCVYISDDIQNGIASTGFANIRVKEPNVILPKYLYYIMTSDYIIDYLTSKAKGAQYPIVSFDDFKTIKISIPSFEQQKNIVNYCEHNIMLIKQLEKEIENNEKQAQQFIINNVKIENKLL